MHTGFQIWLGIIILFLIGLLIKKRQIWEQCKFIKKYYKSGKLEAEILWKSGKQEGLSRYYYESGKLEAEILWKSGKQEGLSRYYYESEKLKLEEFWKEDQLITSFNKNLIA